MAASSRSECGGGARISAHIFFEEICFAVIGKLSCRDVFQLSDVPLYTNKPVLSFAAEDDLILDEVTHGRPPLSS
jgi:hypothetical protein